MPIAIIVLALAGYVYALVVAPAFRVWGLAAGAAACLGLGLYFWFSEPQSAREAALIAPDELTLDQLALDRVGHGATLSGRVLNGSERFRLREMALTLRLRDCPPGAAAETACPVIGEASAVARPDTPPGQIRGFQAQFVFPNLPPATGELRWDWRVTATRAADRA